MSGQFAAGTLVEYAGARWRVQRVLGVAAVLLRSATGEEVSADPLKLQWPDGPMPDGPSVPPTDEGRYSDADWTEAARRRDLIGALARKPSRTAADVAAAAAALEVTPRRIWGLLRQSLRDGDGVAQFLPARRGVRAKRLSAGVEAIIQQGIDQHYAKRARPSTRNH